MKNFYHLVDSANNKGITTLELGLAFVNSVLGAMHDFPYEFIRQPKRFSHCERDRLYTGIESLLAKGSFDQSDNQLTSENSGPVSIAETLIQRGLANQRYRTNVTNLSDAILFYAQPHIDPSRLDELFAFFGSVLEVVTDNSIKPYDRETKDVRRLEYQHLVEHSVKMLRSRFKCRINEPRF